MGRFCSSFSLRSERGLICIADTVDPLDDDEKERLYKKSMTESSSNITVSPSQDGKACSLFPGRANPGLISSMRFLTASSEVQGRKGSLQPVEQRPVV